MECFANTSFIFKFEPPWNVEQYRKKYYTKYYIFYCIGAANSSYLK